MNLNALHNVLYQVLYCIIIANVYALHYDYYYYNFWHYNNELYAQLYIFYRSIVLVIFITNHVINTCFSRCSICVPFLENTNFSNVCNDIKPQ